MTLIFKHAYFSPNFSKRIGLSGGSNWKQDVEVKSTFILGWKQTFLHWTIDSWVQTLKLHFPLEAAFHFPQSLCRLSYLCSSPECDLLRTSTFSCLFLTLDICHEDPYSGDMHCCMKEGMISKGLTVISSVSDISSPKLILSLGARVHSLLSGRTLKEDRHLLRLALNFFLSLSHRTNLYFTESFSFQVFMLQHVKKQMIRHSLGVRKKSAWDLKVDF